jgi:hypothetical protein
MRYRALLLSLAPLLLAAVVAAAPLDPPVRIGILGDRTGDHVPGVYEGIVAEMARLRPDLVLTVGDAIEGYSEDSLAVEAMWAEYDSIIAPLAPILHRAPGNHDITNDKMEPIYRRRYGPPNTSFDYRGVHVVILDTSRYDTVDQMPPAQLAWLTDDLRRNESAPYTIVVMHKPLWYDGVGNHQPDPLHELFVQTGVDAVFTGHHHMYFSGFYDGIRYTSLGSSGGATEAGPTGVLYHYAWLTADREGLHVAPIKAGSVLAWEDVTADQRHRIEAVGLTGLRFSQPFPVPDDLTPSTAQVTLLVDNRAGTVALADTLRWAAPPDWVVTPAVAPVRVAPGADATLTFDVSCKGRLYPTPYVALGFPYDEGRYVAVQKPLRIARAARAQPGTPVIDGRIDEGFWRDAVERLFGPEGGPRKTDPVQFYFAYDKANVYLAAVCHDGRMDSLKAAVTARDGAVYAEDCVGWFLEPVPGSGTVYQIYFNPLGTVFDQKITPAPAGGLTSDRDWNAQVEVRAVRAEFGWTVEARLPIAQFGARVGKNDPWRINFRRKQPRLRTSADWQVPIDYDASTYGVLKFK